MSESNRDKGKALARTILKGTPPGARVPKKWVNYSIDHLFGDVWQGEELDFQQRSMITCATLVALNREAEQEIHFRAARNLGLEREALEAVIIHVAHYAGWPCGASAFRVLNEVWPEED